MKPALVSGIQPSGKLHIGNYLGALSNFVLLQNSGKYSCYFFIANLHSLTEEYAPAEKPGQILSLMEDFLAAGLDPKKSVLFLQSQVPAHSELAWILNTLAPMGELRRMTQFKEKGGAEVESANVGLFDYPVLMAADILLYDAKVVPVGDDQDQHLELARTLARKFNKKYGKTFIEPAPLHTALPRVMSLDDPARKMSKSRPAGCLFLDDAPAVIRKKVMAAVTDSGRDILAEPDHKPAITNLLMLYSAAAGKPIRDIEKLYKGKGYGDFKKGLGDALVKFLAPFQEKKRALAKKTAFVKKTLAEGSKRANAVAGKKLREAQEKAGIAL